METLEAANKTKLITDAFKYVKTFPAVLARFKKFLEKRDKSRNNSVSYLGNFLHYLSFSLALCLANFQPKPLFDAFVAATKIYAFLANASWYIPL